MGVRYYLGLDDKNLSITIYGKNLGIDIPFDLGFAWKVKDLDVPPENIDRISINNTNYDLDGIYDLTFKDMKRYINTSFPTNQTDSNGSIIYNYSMVEVPIPFYKVYDRESGLMGKENFLRIDWDEDLNYSVRMYGDGNQNNFYTALLINAGHFNPNQEKSTTFYWIDALIDNLVLYYKLEEASGNAIDAHNSNDGVPVGTHYQESGWFDYGYGFDSLTTDRIYTPSIAVQSISMWARLTDYTSSTSFLLDAREAHPGVLVYGYVTNKNLRWEATNTWATVYVDNVVYDTGEFTFSEAGWHHLVFIASSSGTGEINIGSSETNASSWGGTIDEIGVWSTGLNSGQVEELYNSGAGLVYPLVSDETPPTYSNNQTNTTGAGTSVNFSILYNDDTVLETAGQYIFSTNNSDGTWTNESAVNFTTTPSWANVTKTLNSTIETVVGYMWYADDNVGNINNTPIYTLTTTDETFPNVTLNLPVDNYNSSSNSITFNGTVLDNYDLVNVSLYGNWTGSWLLNETNLSGINNVDYVFTKVISDGTYIWSYYTCDGTGNCGFATTNRTFTIDVTLPVINITYPTAKVNYHVMNTNLSLNWTVTDANLDSCWYNYNGTNTTVTCADNTTQINITQYSNRNVTFYANDTFENLNSFYREWNYSVFENSQEFNNQTLEGVINTFTANVTVRESNPITVTNFIYNGTSHIASFSQSGNDFILTIDFLSPSVNVNTNLTFFWSLLFSDGQIINLTSYNQTVNIINLDDCSVNTVVLYNYTIVDEANQSQLLNTTAEFSINLLDTERQVYIFNFSKKYSNINPFAVCISENLLSSTYAVDSIVKYEAIGYAIEYYNILDATITNATIPEKITLYDLFSSDATEFKITFKAEDFTFIENALIYIDRQYIAENNSFKTVELPKTDSNGQTIGHFVRNDVLYNIRVIKDGVVLGNFKNQIAFCEDYAIGNCQIILEATPADFTIFNYDEQLGIIFQSVPTYNENTSAISFDFSTDDGTIKTVSMQVTRDDIFGNRSICNNTITSSSGTLTCSFDPNIDDSTLRVNIFVDDQPVVFSNVKLETSVYGNLGYVLWFFLTFIFILLFAYTKTEILIGLTISFTGAISLGIIKGDIIGIGSAGIWVLVIIILGIYKLNKNKPQ